MLERYDFASLPAGFMGAGILGFIITVIYRELLGLSWTFTLGLFFLIMFIASFLSLHYGPIPERELPARRY